jgi:hypothetical protein
LTDCIKLLALSPGMAQNNSYYLASTGVATSDEDTGRPLCARSPKPSR